MKIISNKKFLIKIFLILISIIIFIFLILLFYSNNSRFIKSILSGTTASERLKKLDQVPREGLENSIVFSENEINQAMDTVLKELSKDANLGVNKIWYEGVGSETQLTENAKNKLKNNKNTEYSYIIIGVSRNPNIENADYSFTNVYWTLRTIKGNDKWEIVESGKV